MTDVVSAAEVLHARLATQRLLADRLASPAAVVELLTGVQSQEFGHALWSLGMRSAGTCRRRPGGVRPGRVRCAPTSCGRPGTSRRPEDIGWLLEVTAPRVQRLNGTMYRQLGLDPAGLDRAAAMIVDALAGGAASPGPSSASGSGTSGVPARLPGDERRAGGLIVSGPMRGAQHTYALLADRVPAGTPAGPVTWPSWRAGSSSVTGRPACGTWPGGPR